MPPESSRPEAEPHIQSLEFGDKPREACGVFAIYAPDQPVTELTYLGLQSLQHRGQDAAGIGVYDGSRIIVEKGLGLTTEVFKDGGHTLGEMTEAPMAIGHVRYGTVELQDGFRAAQPLVGESYKFSLAHNGHMENIETLADSYSIDPNEYTSDSECLKVLIDKFATEYGDLEKGLKVLLPQVEGAYSLTLMDTDRIIGVRDRHGFRPLSIGSMTESNGYVIASETPALEIAGATYLRDVQPGEMVIIDDDGLHSETLDVEVNPKLCAFEFVYFSRPDSELQGQNVHLARERMGRMLADDHPVDADIVIGVPDSGISAAMGYAKQLDIPYEQGLTKNKYVARTFIKNKQMSREQAVAIKMHPNRAVIEGKRLVVLDDSIVRGTTTKALVEMLRRAGASEIHLRIPSPPYAWPCIYGMDTGKPDELLAHTRSLDEMREYIGADSLAFLSPERLEAAIALPIGSLCVACTTGVYPTEVPVHLKARVQ